MGDNFRLYIIFMHCIGHAQCQANPACRQPIKKAWTHRFFYNYEYQKKGILGQVMDIFRIWHFHNVSKEGFWPNLFFLLISCTISKVPFWQLFNSAKTAQTEDFFKKDLRHFKKINLGSYEYLASLESKIGRCPFFW